MTEISYVDLGPKILIVDDNPANIMILAKMLQINHYKNIRSITESVKTLETIKEYQPDLILLDLRMPVMDGFEVLKLIKTKAADLFIPVIMITAQSDRESRLQALELGVHDFIGKPFDQREVLFQIKNAVEIKLSHNRMNWQNRILMTRLEAEKHDIEILQMDLINRLLKAVEFRDNSTGEHITRIGLYVSELAKLDNRPERFCDDILYASMLHDIGKIGIPDNILLKQDTLSASEWEIMKQHTIKGGLILKDSQSEILKMGEKIAVSHHEKWDGSGYPYGLSGEDIPLESRLTTICDVFDALLSNRSYKPSWTLDMAIDEIEKRRGTYFEPCLTDLFLSNVDIFIGILNDYLE